MKKIVNNYLSVIQESRIFEFHNFTNSTFVMWIYIYPILKIIDGKTQVVNYTIDCFLLEKNCKPLTAFQRFWKQLYYSIIVFGKNFESTKQEFPVKDIIESNGKYYVSIDIATELAKETIKKSDANLPVVIKNYIHTKIIR